MAIKKISIIAVIIIALVAGIFFGWKKYGNAQKINVTPSIAEISKSDNSAPAGLEAGQVLQNAPAAIQQSENSSIQGENQPTDNAQTKPVETPERDVSPSNEKIISRLASWGFRQSSGRTIDAIIIHSSY